LLFAILPVFFQFNWLILSLSTPTITKTNQTSTYLLWGYFYKGIFHNFDSLQYQWDINLVTRFWKVFGVVVELIWMIIRNKCNIRNKNKKSGKVRTDIFDASRLTAVWLSSSTKGGDSKATEAFASPPLWSALFSVFFESKFYNQRNIAKWLNKYSQFKILWSVLSVWKLKNFVKNTIIELGKVCRFQIWLIE